MHGRGRNLVYGLTRGLTRRAEPARNLAGDSSPTRSPVRAAGLHAFEPERYYAVDRYALRSPNALARNRTKPVAGR